jgi:hypothetical protein
VPFPYEEFDLSGVRTYPLASRQSKARVEDFAKPYAKGSGFDAWLASLPNVLAAGDFRVVVERMVAAKRSGAGGPDAPRLRLGARHQRGWPHP